MAGAGVPELATIFTQTNMKYIQRFLIVLTVLTFFACNSAEHSNAEMDAKSAMSPPASDNSATTVQRKLIKEGEIEFETDDLNKTRQSILKAVNHVGGYIGSDQESKEPAKKVNSIVVRIPADKFDVFISEATAGVSRFDRKDIRVKDVTEEFLDIEARLKTKKELESRFSELLKQAKNVTEILEIEKQMAQLRSDIESIEGRLKYLQSQVSLSTLTLSFYQTIPGETAFGQKFKSGFRNGWDNLIWFLVFMVNVWPFVLIAVATIYLLRYYGRKRKNTVANSR
jgi:hypothetical protein